MVSCAQEVNIIKEYLKRIKARHYVTKAEPRNGRYWLNYSEGSVTNFL